MPVELGQFFQQAAAVSADTHLYVAADQQNIGQGSDLHGLRSLSTAAMKEENRAAVTAFMNAVNRDPVYAQVISQVQGQLEGLYALGSALTAKDVQQVKLTLDVANATIVGKNLAGHGQLPAGHGAAFGQYAILHNLPLETPAQKGAALKDYLLTQVIPANLGNLAAVRGLGENNVGAAAVLKQICDPLTGQNGFYAKALDRGLANGVEHFSFTALEPVFEDENVATLEVLHGLTPSDLDGLSHLPAKELTQTMREALPTLGQQGMRDLFMFMASNMPSLDTVAERMDCIRESLLHDVAVPSARGIMVAHGLPQNFATALGYNPEVVLHARALLTEEPGAGVIPTRERVTEALTQAVEQFTTAHEADLKEFAVMAQTSPVDIKPPLTPETMPRYLNAMLAGDAVLEPLLNENVSLDASFMAKVSTHSEALNSATHSFKGDFGADDVDGVLRNSISLLLARRGVTSEMFPEMMDRAIHKFGSLASNLTTLNFAVQTGFGQEAGIKFLSTGMTAFRSLEGHARALLSFMPREQKVTLGVALPEAPQPGDMAALQREGQLVSKFLEKNFQNDGAMADVPASIRDFARANGLAMPDLDPVQGASQLVSANTEMCSSFLGSLVPSTGHAHENNTQEFRTILAQVGQNHDLTGIDPDRVGAAPMFVDLQRALNKVVSQANAAGQTVALDDLRTAAFTSLTTSFVELKATLTAIDAMPERIAGGNELTEEGVPAFTLAEKALMKELAQTYGLRDAGVIGVLANVARHDDVETTFKKLFHRMATPDIDAKTLAQSANELTKRYLETRHTIEDVKGNEDAMAFMTGMAMRVNGMGQEETQRLVDNLHTSQAQGVAGSFLMGQSLPGVLPAARERCMGISVMMNCVRVAAETQSTGNSALEPMFFSQIVEQLSDVPGGTDGCMDVLDSVIGRTADRQPIIPPTALVLSLRTPILTAAEWNSLSGVIDNLQARAAGDPSASLLTGWVKDSATDVLAAITANQDKPLSDSQLWGAIVGGRMPWGMGGPNFGSQMLAEVKRRYQAQILAAVPDTPGPVMQDALMMHSDQGISPKKMLELTKPGGRLTLADIGRDMRMNSLDDYNPNNAYGLVTDFYRAGQNMEMTFVDHQGNGYATQPHRISDEKNKPDNPEFQEIIGVVRNMTHSEGQTARVLQAFSQAPLIMPRIFSTFFPGTEFSEHGNFSIKAMEQPDGAVVVDITSDPALPLGMTQQYRIETNGSHTCTAFDMVRTPLA